MLFWEIFALFSIISIRRFLRASVPRCPWNGEGSPHGRIDGKLIGGQSNQSTTTERGKRERESSAHSSPLLPRRPATGSSWSSSSLGDHRWHDWHQQTDELVKWMRQNSRFSIERFEYRSIPTGSPSVRMSRNQTAKRWFSATAATVVAAVDWTGRLERIDPLASRQRGGNRRVRVRAGRKRGRIIKNSPSDKAADGPEINFSSRRRREPVTSFTYRPNGRSDSIENKYKIGTALPKRPSEIISFFFY